jgi:putative glutamine amidotransferase
MKPVIAITPEVVTLARAAGRGAFCGLLYSYAIEAADGVPVVLPLTHDTEVLDQHLEHCDGLLLSGGGDPSPRFYSPPLTTVERDTLSGADEIRDAMELHLIREAIDLDLPVLGICRGIQMLNLAAGGTLLPDISLRVPGALPHQNPQPDAFVHTVRWEPVTRLAEILGDGCDRVNSNHHQGLHRIAPGFEVAGCAPDGIVEAIEKPGARFVAGVLFHPERLLGVAPQFARLFQAFVEACRR